MSIVLDPTRLAPARESRPVRLRVAIVADFAEERWISMEMAADVLLERFGSGTLSDIDATRLRPSLQRRLTRLPRLAATPRADTADRVINRFWDYPRWLRHHAAEFDLFHIVDHTYAHLALELPADRTIVTVHDVDAFLPLVHPAMTTSTLPPRLAARTLRGLRSVARVLCVSEATRAELDRYRLVPLERVTVVHNGVDAVFSAGADAASDADIASLIGRQRDDLVDLVHCGTTIERKRIDLLLKVIAGVRAKDPRVRLLKAGGSLTAEQMDLARSLNVHEAIVPVPFLDRPQLAALYRRARAALITSSREGFCLPLVEALACGTAVVASDIPVLREIGAGACTYVPVGDVERWTGAVLAEIQRTDLFGRERQLRLRRASEFSLQSHAEAVADAYRHVAGRAELRDGIFHATV